MDNLFKSNDAKLAGFRLLLEDYATPNGTVHVAVVTSPPGKAVIRIGVGPTLKQAVADASSPDEHYRLDAFDVRKPTVRAILSGRSLGYSWMSGEPGTNGETLERFRDTIRATLRRCDGLVDATASMSAWASEYLSPPST